MKRDKNEIVCRIPGGWYGNNPGHMPDPFAGNVTIDPKRTVEAIRWLSRRATIKETRIVPTVGNPGLTICYRLKHSVTVNP